MMKNELINYFFSFLTDSRKQKLEEKINYRTKHMTIVLEDIFQSHNASAVLRSCECFGINDVHFIENKFQYEVNPDIALGSSNWLNIIRHNEKENNTIECINKLKEEGYKIIATTPHKNDCNLEDFNIDSKFALIFGTELEGLSKTAISSADGFIKIPMVGFTESLNISVSAAICLHHLTLKIRNSEIKWQLSEKEKEETMLQWLRKSMSNVELIEKEYKLRNNCE